MLLSAKCCISNLFPLTSTAAVAHLQRPRRGRMRLQLVVRARVVLVVAVAAGSATRAGVDLARDGADGGLDLCELLLELVGLGGGALGVEPVAGLLDDLEELLLVGLVELRQTLAREMNEESVDGPCHQDPPGRRAGP